MTQTVWRLAAVNRHHITGSTSHEPHCSFRVLFSQPAGHGPVHTDEKHAVIIPQQKKETTTCTSFCNYLVLEVEGLEEKDFQTFRNEAVKLLSNIQNEAKECDHQLQQPTQ